jgi:glycyl-tRNA synthetase beta chain
MSPDLIVLRHANEYEDRLLRDGRVIADFATRRDKIEQQIIEAAENIGGVATIDPSLLDEVTSMVEWPVAVTGSFDEEFLELPEQVLIATMQGHQRYFPIADPYGALAPRFITVSNIESTNPDAVRAGNERVIRPRLKDAAFFFDNDLRTPIDDWLGQLESMVFQDKLGSLADKARRVSELARHVAVAMGAGPDVVRAAVRAGMLSKSDLVTEMVGEFPELQGTIGAAYARRQGEDEQVANAMAEVYRPRFAGDAIPGTPGGMALAVADKLDTLVGIFGIGLAPSGDRDPYALRRAALGALRIIIEGKLDVSLGKLVQAAIDGYGATFGPDLSDGSSVAELVTGFMEDRLRAYFTEQGIGVDVFLAVQAKQPQRPLDFAARVLAVNAFRALPEAASLTAANKRIQNILRQADLEIPADVDDALLSEDAEWNLAAKLVGLGPSVSEHLKSGNYEAALTQLAGMQETIDGFFDAVKVMDDDVKVRANRLALLNTVGQLFMETADISQLQG